MSDSFNHDHYLSKNKSVNSFQEQYHLNIEELLNKRTEQLPSFQVMVLKNGVIENNLDIPFKNNTYFIDNKKVYFIKINTNEHTTNIDVANNSELIIEDVFTTQLKVETNIYFINKNIFYYLPNYSLKNLNYNTINIFINGNVSSNFITKPNKLNHKNKIIYNLDKGSNLSHVSFSSLRKEQIIDDSIEIFHRSESLSSIEYISLNNGKISTQINSVIPAESNFCETHQNISHIVLSEQAITQSKPNLMIENKNVIASHGNNIGGIKDEDLFYLAQRGINEEKSKSILADSKLFICLPDNDIKDYILKYYKETSHEY